MCLLYAFYSILYYLYLEMQKIKSSGVEENGNTELQVYFIYINDRLSLYI